MTEPLTPLLLSIKISLIVTVLLLLAVPPVAWWLSRTTSFLRSVALIAGNLPLVLPPTVIGFYFLVVFGPAGPIGTLLGAMGTAPLVFSFPGLTLASLLVNIPFMLNPVVAGCDALPRSLTEAACVLGKGRLETYCKVIVPCIMPSLVTGAAMTFMHTMGEFGVALMVGGKIPGKTYTASIALFDCVETMRYHAAHGYAAILLVLSCFLLALLFRLPRHTRVV